MMSQKGIPSLFLERLAQIVPLPQQAIGDFSFRAKQKTAFRVNTLKVSIDEVHGLLREEGITFDAVPWYAPAFLVETGAAKLLLQHALAAEGKIYAQALSSMVPAVVLDPQPGERVLDLCAAPGSKTTQIAAHMHNEGQLIANEAIKARFFRLKAVTALLGAKARLTMVDGRRYALREDEPPFDRILVDAPCSSEGRFNAEDPDSVGYWSKRKIEEMSHKQKGLLLNAARLLKPGGILVYATCTFAPEENEEVVDWFLRKSDGRFFLEPVEVKGIARYPALNAWGKRCFAQGMEACLRILPDKQMEGFFVACLRCRGA